MRRYELMANLLADGGEGLWPGLIWTSLKDSKMIMMMIHETMCGAGGEGTKSR